MLLRRLDGLLVLQHALLELPHQPGEVLQGRVVVVLKTGRGVSSLQIVENNFKRYCNRVNLTITMITWTQMSTFLSSCPHNCFICSSLLLPYSIHYPFLPPVRCPHLLFCTAVLRLLTIRLSASVSSLTLVIALTLLWLT